MKLNAQHCTKQRWVGVKTQSFEGSVFVIVDLWNHNLSFFLSLPFSFSHLYPLFFLVSSSSSLWLSTSFQFLPFPHSLYTKRPWSDHIDPFHPLPLFPLFNPSLFPPSRPVLHVIMAAQQQFSPNRKPLTYLTNTWRNCDSGLSSPPASPVATWSSNPDSYLHLLQRAYISLNHHSKGKSEKLLTV